MTTIDTTTQIPEILVVDDLPENLKTLAAMLNKHDFKVRFAQNGKGALRNVSAKKPDLILLDIRMPDMDGYEVCRKLKSNPATADVPVIFISALSDAFDKVKAFQAGGIDYVTKPFNPEEVLARINTHLHLRRLQQRLTRYNETLEEKVLERTAALLASRNQYSRFVEGLPVGAFRAEPEVNGRILMANPAAVTMLGCSSFAELRQSSLQDFQCNSPELEEFIKALRTERSVRDFELPMTRRDGTPLLVKISAQIVVDDQVNTHYLDGIIEDITELRKAENARRRLEKQLRQAQKMEAIGTLAGGIAHDFNNILTAIIGHTELAINDALMDSRPIRSLQEVLNASLRAKELTSQILSFSRRQKTEPRSVQVKMICKEVLKLLSASLPATIEIRENLLSDAMIMADPVEIHQVLMNLTTNGAQAMQGMMEGRLEIVLEDVDIDEHFELAHQIAPGRYQKLSVSDNGKGIPANHIDHIFEPFFSTKGEEGTGLGLSVVHTIVKNFQGAISVYSEPGQGTTFSIFWPITSDMSKEVNYDEIELPKGTESILFVDDEEIILGVLENSLTWLGYDVTPVMDSREALEIFRANPSRFDLIITDQTMPRMTGDVLAQKIREVRRDIPIILCTGNIAINFKKNSEPGDIQRVIMKPLLLRELAAHIRETLDGK